MAAKKIEFLCSCQLDWCVQLAFLLSILLCKDNVQWLGQCWNPNCVYPYLATPPKTRSYLCPVLLHTWAVPSRGLLFPGCISDSDGGIKCQALQVLNLLCLIKIRGDIFFDRHNLQFLNGTLKIQHYYNSGMKSLLSSSCIILFYNKLSKIFWIQTKNYWPFQPTNSLINFFFPFFFVTWFEKCSKNVTDTKGVFKELLKLLSESVVWAQLKLFRVESNSLCVLGALWDHVSEGDAMCGCQRSADTELLLHAVLPWAFFLVLLPLPPRRWLCFRMSPEHGWILEVRGKGISGSLWVLQRAGSEARKTRWVQPPRAAALP